MSAPPITIDLPLSGEWYVGADGTEPGHELALDLMRLDHKLKATSRPAWRELLTAIPYEEHYGWGQPILSPFQGRVVALANGCAETPKSFLMKFLGGWLGSFSPRQRRQLAQMESRQAGDIQEFAGNHLVIESLAHPQVFAFLAHARPGSITARVGDMVQARQKVAEVGDTGQSLLPHLHFHLMSSPNPLAQQVIPFVFASYEAHIGGQWVPQHNTLPTRRQRIRSVT